MKEQEENSVQSKDECVTEVMGEVVGEPVFHSRIWKVLTAAVIIVALILFVLVTANRLMHVTESSAQSMSSLTNAGIAMDGFYGSKSDMSANSVVLDNGSGFVSSEMEQTVEQADISLLEDKLVYRADLNIEVLEFDKDVQAIKQLAEQYGGVIQSDSYDDTRNWYIDHGDTKLGSGYQREYITVRIPTAKYEGFLSEATGTWHVTGMNQDVTNISSEYYDTQALLESYRNQLEVLQGMYAKAQTIEDMLSIQDRIADVSACINQYETAIRRMDVDVAYSTITLNIQSVEEYSTFGEDDRGFFTKLGEAFVDGFEAAGDALTELALFAAYHVIAIIVIAAVIVIVVRTVKKRKQKKVGK